MYSAVTYISNVDFGSENSELKFDELKVLTQADLNRTRHVNRFEKALDYEEDFNFEDLSEQESCDCIVKNPKNFQYDKMYGDEKYLETRKIRLEELNDFYRSSFLLKY